MRRYNLTVFHDFVEGTTERFSSAKHIEVLGSADVFVLQWRATKVSGTTPKLTVVLYGSDNGVDWITRETLVSNYSLSSGGLNTSTADSTTRPMAMGRLGVTLGGRLRRPTWS